MQSHRSGWIMTSTRPDMLTTNTNGHVCNIAYPLACLCVSGSGDHFGTLDWCWPIPRARRYYFAVRRYATDQLSQKVVAFSQSRPSFVENMIFRRP
ncbi:unnamed protein product [Protopolystoma xenopodis]|uniref:Uncharacterized protein n=1 Tax=Protopolystoma xenopodis TaxID=117903 RepID=A0A3S5AN42_9PLAT|nr:unnamed protein product [Protopolystoma xenopodis]